jgi:uncharacterized protein YkwD
MNKTNKANQSSILNRGILRGIGCFVIAGIMAVGGVFATGAFGFGTMEVYATGEATITIEVARRQETFTRSEFINRHSEPFYYNGNVYTAAEFFDAYNGSSFLLGMFSFREAQDRFGVDGIVWRPTLIATAPAPVVTPTPVAPIVTPAPTPTAPIATPQAPQTPNVPSIPVATPVPPVSPNVPNDTDYSPTITWAEELSRILALENRALSAEQRERISRGDVHNQDLTVAQRQEIFPYSSIVIPNRRLTTAEIDAWVYEYHNMGGPSMFELELVRLVNEVRAEHGLHPLEINMTFMKVARLYTQTMANLNLGIAHDAGPYRGPHNATRNNYQGILAALGHSFSDGGTGGNGGGHDMTPQNALNGWMNSPGHRANILNPNFTQIGVGSHLGAQNGVFQPVWHYQIFM